MNTESLRTPDDPDWLRLRIALWPETTADEHREEMAAFVKQPTRYAQFLVRSQERAAVGFAEASLRTDYVNGTKSSPVAFLEGLYVSPEARGQGAAKALVAAVVRWATSVGCSELASDTQLENNLGQAVHARLGFTETERVVFFNMRINPHAA